MADVADATTPPVGNQSTDEPTVYRGSPRNLVPGTALLFAGVLAFSMGMTDVFFAEATAWTFAIWGLLLIYGGLLDIYNTYEVTDEALIIRNPMRPWGTTKVWDWGHINRLDVVIKRPDARHEDVVTQVFYTAEGELALEREDRQFDPFLTQQIIERAGLRPADKANPQDLHNLPPGRKVTYTWS